MNHKTLFYSLYRRLKTYFYPNELVLNDAKKVS